MIENKNDEENDEFIINKIQRTDEYLQKEHPHIQNDTNCFINYVDSEVLNPQDSESPLLSADVG